MNELKAIHQAVENLPDVFKAMPLSTLFELIPKQRDTIIKLESELKEAQDELVEAIDCIEQSGVDWKEIRELLT